MIVAGIDKNKRLLIFVIYFFLMGCNDSNKSNDHNLSLFDLKSDILCKKPSAEERNNFFLKNYTCLLQLLFDETCLKLNQNSYEKFTRLSFLDGDQSVDILSVRQYTNRNCYIESIKNIPPNLYTIHGYYRPEGIVQYSVQSLVTDENRFYELSNLREYFSDQEWDLDHPPAPPRLWLLEILYEDELYTGYADSDNLTGEIQSKLGLLLGFTTIYSIDPNPFQKNTMLAFNLPTKGTVQFEIRDLSDNFVVILEMEGTKGFNQYEMNLGEIPPGIYKVDMILNNEKIWPFRIRKI